jgi:hypothetical protein
MPLRPEDPDAPEPGREPDRQKSRPAPHPDLDTDQLVRARKPQLVPPGTIIEDDDDDHQPVAPERPGLPTDHEP